jgi:hypothetical protein
MSAVPRVTHKRQEGKIAASKHLLVLSISAPGRSRTSARIRKPLLYPLSYGGESADLQGFFCSWRNSGSLAAPPLHPQRSLHRRRGGDER